METYESICVLLRLVLQVLACLLELNAARCKLDAAYGPPEHVFLTGGGGQVPEVLTCVR